MKPISPKEFEVLVRKLARIKWPGVTGGSEKIAGTQIDGVFRTDEFTHLVEMTVERDMNKVRGDVNKLDAAQRDESRRAYGVDCWMVMLAEPTPDQRTLARSNQVRLVSVDEFLDQILSKQEYMHLREKHFFGSVSDPSNTVQPDRIKWYSTPITVRETGKDINLDSIANRLINGETIVLLGDFGAGKSLTVREIYRKLDEQTDDLLGKFPIAVNLREHWGQKSGSELFTRHAESIGSSNGLQFYRAWVEGFVFLLLDGFDEVAPQPWTNERAALRAIRKRAMSAVRSILETKPTNVGLLITGRTYFFPSEEEMSEALGVTRKAVTIAELRELDDAEAAAFLKQYGVDVPLSRFLPKRPLLLSYLATSGYVDELAGISKEQDVGKAWVSVVEMVCKREAGVSEAIHGDTVADILCRLAQNMRVNQQNLGPIFERDLEQSFRDATGYQPDHDAWAILQRLPGVVFRGQGQKWFVDEEWADALAGIALARIVRGEITVGANSPKVKHPLGPLGQLVAASVIAMKGGAGTNLVTHCHKFIREGLDPTLVADAIGVAQIVSTKPISFSGLVVHGAYVGDLDLTESMVSEVLFSDCYFSSVTIEAIEEGVQAGVKIDASIIDTLDGISKPSQLPVWITRTDVGTYRFPNTNAELINSNLPVNVKIAMVALRKVYMQAGRGRKMSALTRGIDPRQAAVAHAVVVRLESLGYFIVKKETGGEIVVYPCRSKHAEVREMVSRRRT